MSRHWSARSLRAFETRAEKHAPCLARTPAACALRPPFRCGWTRFLTAPSLTLPTVSPCEQGVGKSSYYLGPGLGRLGGPSVDHSCAGIVGPVRVYMCKASVVESRPFPRTGHCSEPEARFRYYLGVLRARSFRHHHEALADLVPRLVYASANTPPIPNHLLKLDESYG